MFACLTIIYHFISLYCISIIILSINLSLYVTHMNYMHIYITHIYDVYIDYLSVCLTVYLHR